jgi:glyoxylase-like metal-dependent hydrolase (beta-lactamase superfamily II)
VAQRQAWLARQLPPAEQVAAGLWSVPVTIPDSPLRYTLAYLISSADAVIAVDPGWDSDAGWRDLLAGFEAAGVAAGRVTGIVVTHVHPDHHGLSARLRSIRGVGRDARRGGGTLPAPDLALAAGRQATAAGCAVPVAGAADHLHDRQDSRSGGCQADVLLNDGDDIDLPGGRCASCGRRGYSGLPLPATRLRPAADH